MGLVGSRSPKRNAHAGTGRGTRPRRIEGGETFPSTRDDRELGNADDTDQFPDEPFDMNQPLSPTPNPPPKGGPVLAAGRARGPGTTGLGPAHSVWVSLAVSRVRKPGFARP